MKTIIKNPLYFDCQIVWKDDNTSERVIIKLGNYDESENGNIVFYVDSLMDINTLLDDDNGEDFYIEKIYSINNYLK